MLVLYMVWVYNKTHYFKGVYNNSTADSYSFKLAFQTSGYYFENPNRMCTSYYG